MLSLSPVPNTHKHTLFLALSLSLSLSLSVTVHGCAKYIQPGFIWLFWIVEVTLNVRQEAG